MACLITSIPQDQIKRYVINQLNTFFPDGKVIQENEKAFSDAFQDALKRTEFCFDHIVVRGFSQIDDEGIKHPYFQHTNSDQYCQFLYFLSNSLWRMDPKQSWICDKIILLNKLLHGCWYTYKVVLPDVFLVVHPIGAIIGHAKYNNYLVICQNVTIGERRFSANAIGEWCFLSGGATIIGDAPIGKRVSIGANTTIFRKSVPDNSICYTDRVTGNVVIKENKKPKCKAEEYFTV